MKPPIVIIGIGELGGVFAKAFLRQGHPVYPITRALDVTQAAKRLPDPRLVLVAVAEMDFHEVMDNFPVPWRSRIVLLQNELLPRDWEAYGIDDPTVISVWFEKKKGMDYHPILPSPVYGKVADLIAESLTQIEIPSKVLNSRDDLIFELVLKNVFVFTINIAGLVLEDGATTATLWQEHQKLALDVAEDVIDLQEYVTGNIFSRQRLKAGFHAGIEGDPNHRCKGRSAPERLTRLVKLADEADLKIQTIRDIYQRLAS